MSPISRNFDRVLIPHLQKAKRILSLTDASAAIGVQFRSAVHTYHIQRVVCLLLEREREKDRRPLFTPARERVARFIR